MTCRGCRSLKCASCASARIARSRARARSGGFFDLINPLAGANNYPANLNLSRWWRDPPTSAPWFGTKSKGVSGAGGSALTTGGGSAGIVLKTRRTTLAAGGSFAGTGSGAVVLGSSYWSLWVLYRSAGNGAVLATPHLAESIGGTYLDDIASDFGPTNFDISGGSELTPGVWKLLQLRMSPIVGVEIRLNNHLIGGNVWSSGGGAPATIATAFSVASCGDLAEVGVAQSVLSTQQFDNIRRYCNARYGVAV